MYESVTGPILPPEAVNVTVLEVIVVVEPLSSVVEVGYPKRLAGKICGVYPLPVGSYELIVAKVSIICGE